jgi:hypothetical protein
VFHGAQNAAVITLVLSTIWRRSDGAIGHAGDFPPEPFNSRFGDMNSRLAAHKSPFWETREIGVNRLIRNEILRRIGGESGEIRD